MASATAPELTCPPPFPWPSRGSPDAFEFRLDDPVAMLPADELFSGGRLVPLQLAPPPPPAADEILSPELPDTPREEAVGPSPRAPKCSSRWRELLGLKSKAAASAGGGAASRYTNPNPRSLKLFLRRDPKSSPADPSMSLSLLRDSDSESVSLSSRRSLSSSSSSSSGEDLPRLSLDAEKPNQIPILLSRNPHPPKVKVRVSRPRSGTPERRTAARSSQSPARRTAEDGAAAPRGAAVDSPRMNASGRVVFQGLDRSSSSPGSFNGGPRVRNWAMERSYSAGVRVTPVLNVPAFGLGNLFRKEREGSSSRTVTGGGAGAGSSKGKTERERVSNN